MTVEHQYSDDWQEKTKELEKKPAPSIFLPVKSPT
jgi:hypothetical protein